MPRESARVADTRAWLRKAENDMRAAEHDTSAAPPLLEDIVFHCQQVAEKSLKAFLTWHDRPFRKTHSLEELGEACIVLDPSLKSAIDPIVPLTQYAWKFRYPGDVELPSMEDANVAIESARDLLATVRRRLQIDYAP